MASKLHSALRQATLIVWFTTASLQLVTITSPSRRDVIFPSSVIIRKLPILQNNIIVSNVKRVETILLMLRTLIQYLYLPPDPHAHVRG